MALFWFICGFGGVALWHSGGLGTRTALAILFVGFLYLQFK